MALLSTKCATNKQASTHHSWLYVQIVNSLVADHTPCASQVITVGMSSYDMAVDVTVLIVDPVIANVGSSRVGGCFEINMSSGSIDSMEDLSARNVNLCAENICHKARNKCVSRSAPKLLVRLAVWGNIVVARRVCGLNRSSEDCLSCI